MNWKILVLDGYMTRYGYNHAGGSGIGRNNLHHYGFGAGYGDHTGDGTGDGHNCGGADGSGEGSGIVGYSDGDGQSNRENIENIISA